MQLVDSLSTSSSFSSCFAMNNHPTRGESHSGGFLLNLLAQVDIVWIQSILYASDFCDFQALVSFWCEAQLKQPRGEIHGNVFLLTFLMFPWICSACVMAMNHIQNRVCCVNCKNKWNKNKESPKNHKHLISIQFSLNYFPNVAGYRPRSNHTRWFRRVRKSSLRRKSFVRLSPLIPNSSEYSK
jgi:hypothetical protein